ncbi:MAG: hypothetical protein ABI134_08015, partial [Byssovorax sp.]
MTRLQRFRAYMGRMNPVADPALAIREGLYVAPPGRSVAEELATRLELEPASTHLVIGGIGSGKTSELLRAVERLKASFYETGDHVEYLDVSRWCDISELGRSTTLTSLAGLSLANHAKPLNTPKAQAGLVVAEATVPYGIERQAAQLQTTCAAYPGKDKQVIFFFDSLDRLGSPARFREAVHHDLQVLKAAGIGATIVGPIRFLVGADRSIADLFDHIHFQLAADPSLPEGLSFLTRVLRARAEPDILSDECVKLLANASGGMMRDLITLAKRT